MFQRTETYKKDENGNLLNENNKTVTDERRAAKLTSLKMCIRDSFSREDGKNRCVLAVQGGQLIEQQELKFLPEDIKRKMDRCV